MAAQWTLTARCHAALQADGLYGSMASGPSDVGCAGLGVLVRPCPLDRATVVPGVRFGRANVVVCCMRARSQSLLHAGRDVEDTGTRVKASDMRLFAQRDVPSEETIKGTWAVHAVLCVPPDRSRADSADTTAVSGASSACVTPLGSLLLLFTCAIVLWSAAFLVLLVWNVAKNSHHFGCVPYGECTEGPWPRS